MVLSKSQTSALWWCSWAPGTSAASACCLTHSSWWFILQSSRTTLALVLPQAHVPESVCLAHGLGTGQQLQFFTQFKHLKWNLRPPQSPTVAPKRNLDGVRAWPLSALCTRPPHQQLQWKGPAGTMSSPLSPGLAGNQLADSSDASQREALGSTWPWAAGGDTVTCPFKQQDSERSLLTGEVGSEKGIRSEGWLRWLEKMRKEAFGSEWRLGLESFSMTQWMSKVPLMGTLVQALSPGVVIYCVLSRHPVKGEHCSASPAQPHVATPSTGVSLRKHSANAGGPAEQSRHKRG